MLEVGGQRLGALPRFHKFHHFASFWRIFTSGNRKMVKFALYEQRLNAIQTNIVSVIVSDPSNYGRVGPGGAGRGRCLDAGSDGTGIPQHDLGRICTNDGR